MERGRLAYGGASSGTEPPSNFYSDMVQSNRADNDYQPPAERILVLVLWIWLCSNQDFGY